MTASGVTSRCALCDREIVPKNSVNPTVSRYICRTCGMVEITDQAILALGGDALQGAKYLLSALTRERTEQGLQPVKILSHNIQSLVDDANRPRSVVEKLDRLMIHLSRKSDYPGKRVGLVPVLDYPLAFAKNSEEFDYLLEQLLSLGWVEKHGSGAFEEDGYRGKGVVLTVDGWNRLIEISRHRKVSDQAFVAMWFDQETEKAYSEGIEKAVKQAGYNPLRVDRLEHNNKICDLIIAEIRKSAFLIADFTGHRGGVYFEAGFALGLGIPVIWLCRADQIKDAHFDTRQYNHIVWENETQLYEKLLNRINATIVH